MCRLKKEAFRCADLRNQCEVLSSNLDAFSDAVTIFVSKPKSLKIPVNYDKPMLRLSYTNSRVST